MKTALYANRKRDAQNLMQPVVYEDFGCLFRKSDPTALKTVRVFSKTERGFAESGNLVKPCGNSLSQKNRKRLAETFMKPVVHADFRVPFPEEWPKMIKNY